jgi:hypothetical protein
MGLPVFPIGSTPELDAESQRRIVRRAMHIGLWVWPSFALLDAWMCFVAYPGAPFGLFLIYRLAVEMAFALVYRASGRPGVPVAHLTYGQDLCFGMAALGVALMAVHLGGIVSPYMHGISIVALVRAAVVPEAWRRSLPSYGRIGLAFPLVMGIGVLLSPQARLEEAHAAGIIHRDIKPENLVLCRTVSGSGLLKLLDFGIARLRMPETGVQLTRPGFLAGTPAYMAPELWLAQPADERSDIYSLGITLCFILTGETPPRTTEDVFVAWANRPRAAAIPEPLKAVIRRCLGRRPEDRYQSARELRLALETIPESHEKAAGLSAPAGMVSLTDVP